MKSSKKDKSYLKYAKIIPKRFLKDENEIRRTLKNSCEFDKSFQFFEERRKVIVKAIHKQGSFLDIGCANGLFLKFLQHWSKYELDLYGIEARKNLLLDAKKMFPKKTSHFEIIYLKEFILNTEKRKKLNFPPKFDFIFWNMWDKMDFTLNSNFEIFNGILKFLKKEGRFILKFYNLKGKGYKHISQLEKRGIVFDKKIEESHYFGDATILAWIQK